jgi:hypothetical protein
MGLPPEAGALIDRNAGSDGPLIEVKLTQF